MTRFPPDAIVVLGGSVRSDGSLSHALRRRVAKAAQAFHQNLAPFVVCSGGKSWNGFLEAIQMRDSLLDLNVPPTQIITELQSYSTAENAWYCAKLFRLRSWSSALLVSCPWHLPRAVTNFNACGIQSLPLASDCSPLGFPSSLWRSCVELTCQHLDLARIRRWQSL